MSDVYVVGLGAVTPLGNNLTDTWNNLINGKLGLSKLDPLDGVPINVIGRADDSFYASLSAPERRYCRFSQLALVATKEAWKDSKLDRDKCDSERIGVYIGTGIGGVNSLLNAYDELRSKSYKRVSPFTVPRLMPNSASALISIYLKSHGPSNAIVSACSSGADAIVEGYNAISNDVIDIAVVGGAESTINDITLAAFNNMMAMNRTSDVSRASIPFDKLRNGFIMSEGSGMMILISDKYLSSSQKPYCKIVGYGLSSDGYNMVQPDPTGKYVKYASLSALKRSSASINDVIYINAHATSTKVGDLAEANAIRNTYGKYADNIYVSSTKGYTGHMLGASGAIESIFTALSCNKSLLPYMNHIHNKDEDINLNFVLNKPISIEEKDKLYLNHSFGFGGHNTVIVFKVE